MVPDFVLVDTKDENRRIIIELVGFWHPQYLRRKVEKVRAANCAHFLLLVYKGLNVTEEAFQDAASQVIFFQEKPVIKEVMETVDEMAKGIYGPRTKPNLEVKGDVPRNILAVAMIPQQTIKFLYRMSRDSSRVLEMHGKNLSRA